MSNIKMKNILQENMHRFGTKNLNEDNDRDNNGYPDTSQKPNSESNWYATKYIYLKHLPNPDYKNILNTHHAKRIKDAFNNANLRAVLNTARYYDELEIGFKKEEEPQILDTLRKIGYAPDTIEDLYRRAAMKLGINDNPN
jgi:hypothetical protein